MRHLTTQGFKKLAAVALLASMAVSTTAIAAGQAASGLGQAWPNAQDVSSSPHWHVYVFERNGVRYIQVNDLNGNVRGAFAASGGNYLVLPIGVDATRVATPQDRLPAPASKAGEIVYRDNTVKVMVAPQTSNTTQILAVDAMCQDPIECSSRLN